jgi:hypothetical protein
VIVCCCLQQSWSGCKCLLLSPSVLESVRERLFLYPTAWKCVWVPVAVPYSVGVCVSVCCCPLHHWSGCKCLLLPPTVLECVGVTVAFKNRLILKNDFKMRLS